MSRFVLVLMTAVVSAVLTSLFWMLLYSSRAAPDEGAPVLTETLAPDAPTELVLAPSGLAVPVAGIGAADLVDTYTEARGADRLHNAIDIMAPHGTPVIAAADGEVEKLFYSHGGGGITAYVRSADGNWVHYYAHLQAYAPGLAEGQPIKRGDPIGTVGSSGNASPDGPHLHFAVHRMAPGESWHQGIPVNPYPLLAGDGAAR